ncbi:MAG: alpha/beta fold hydrolase [Acidobacteria bacterium]|nr:alpha/beta fold hydrolase [Acidobacteriota bacterium]
MQDAEFSLFHHTALPKSAEDGEKQKPPLLILLHGYGANEDDLFSLAPFVDERFFIVCVRAPIRIGMGSYAWFRLGFTPEGILIDPNEVEAARQTLRQFVDEAVTAYHADPKAVFLLGFSQGAMMSLDLALREPSLIAGVAALSGRIMPTSSERFAPADELIGLPIFMAHGTSDPVLPIGNGRSARDQLRELPISLTYREYEMGHEICEQELRDLTEWLTLQLSQFTIH